jgi:hypothetical protein
MKESNMKTSLAVVAALLVFASVGLAQVKNEALANQIIQARQKNAALLKQYVWNSNTVFMENGETKDTRIDQVMYGPDGNLQRIVLNNEGSHMPRGFLRRAIAENKKTQMEEYLTRLHTLLDQYTLPSAGALINFISQSNITTGTAPDGTPILTMTGNGVVNPGDTLSMTVNPTNFATRRMEINTSYNGDPVTVTATFRTMPSGLTHVQYATVEVPDKGITLQIHNYDYVPND